MAPLQVILLLLLVRLPAILQSSDGAVPRAGAPVGNLSAAWVIGSLLISHLLVVIIVMQRTRAGVRLVHQPTVNASAVSGKLDHLFGMARWATLGITAIHLYGLGLTGIVTGWLGTTVVFKHIPLVAEVIYILPAGLAWVGSWMANYELEFAIRERTFPYRLATGLPTHEMPGVGHYLSMQIRHNFYLVILVGVTSGVEELGERLDPYVPHAAALGTPLAIGAMLLMVPWLITRMWSTVPLRGELRMRLDRLAGQYHLRFRDIRIWKTHNHISNAAILGWVPFARYFLMTDALLETLTDQQIEAVFAHEVGHGVHRHIWWYLVGIIGALMVCAGVAEIAQSLIPSSWMGVWLHYLGDRDALDTLLVMGMLALFMSFGFSFVSHRFEHQADWFAAKHMGKELAAHPGSAPVVAKALVEEPDPLEVTPALLDPMMKEEPTATEKMTLEEYAAGKPVDAAVLVEAKTEGMGTGVNPAVAGAEVFISSLDTIIELAHRSRDKKGWMHPSVNNRMALLRNLAMNPGAVAAFQRRMVTTRILILLIVVVGAAALVVAGNLPQSEGQQGNGHSLDVDRTGK